MYIDALAVAVINDHRTRDVAMHWLGGSISPPKLNVSSPQTEFANLILLCESARKYIISHKIPQKFFVSGHSPPDPTI